MASEMALEKMIATMRDRISKDCMIVSYLTSGNEMGDSVGKDNQYPD